MGQYWLPVNLDKREFVQPHKLGAGLKLWEQLAAHPGTGAALIILCAAMPQARGGGDFDLDQNWHGPERVLPRDNIKPGPMPESYAAVAKRTIGRWAGDRIALVGDYAERGDLPHEFMAERIYGLCPYNDEERKEILKEGVPQGMLYTNISDDVARVIEHELQGSFVGEGWKHFKCREDPPEPEQPSKPNGKIHVVSGGGADVQAAMKELFGILGGVMADIEASQDDVVSEKPHDA